RDRPFVAVNCGAVPETLLESELFGHVRGAFTDAHMNKKGLMEVAEGGTIFLDEIGEMAPMMRVKLLRVIQDRRFRRLGGTDEVQADVRIIAATNQDLPKMVADGRFREDLYYRLNVMSIHVPPLRDRVEDIPKLVEFYVDAYNTEFKKRVKGVVPEAMRQLERYPWPGNIRELRNAVERAMLLTEADTLTVQDLTGMGAGPVRLSDHVELPAAGIDLEQLERSLLIQALKRTGWNQTRAATLLGLNRDQIRYRIEKFQLEKSGPA
ncbi:MAG: sigma-54 dependent transcriptional regulator, partial [Vicinamibacterales bacterium]